MDWLKVVKFQIIRKFAPYENFPLYGTFQGRNILPTPATYVLQKHFTEFIIANMIKVTISSMQSLTREKKIS